LGETVKLLLTAISGSREGKTFTIEPNECITFGRTNASHWSFEDDGHMSSIHFEVENLGADAEVRDRGSTNGTWLNNQKILTEKLREGDRLRAGKTVLTVEFVQPMVAAELVDQPVTHGTFVRESPRQDLDNTPTPPSDEFFAQPPERTPLPALRPLAVPDRADTPPARPINPFDSIDFAAETPVKHEPPAPAPWKSDEGRVHNPISDSSVSFQVTPSSGDVLVPTARSQGGFSLHERRTSVEAADGIAIILDTLSQKWSIQVVLHFQKIRTTPPAAVGKPLFDWLTAEESLASSPIRLGWNEVTTGKEILPLIPRLCRADACIAFLSRSSVSLGPQVDQMVKLGIDGFSEANGFLSTCWPSSFATLVDVKQADVCRELFSENISGAIFCSPWNSYKVVAVADPSLAQDLADAMFSVAHRFTDR
jgi:pSer/pThr/pTyr-binding forkhead associated (FHA) protein